MSSPAFRFWLSTRTIFASDPSLIRVAWTVQGVEQSALGYVDDTRIVWNLGAEVPSRLDRDAFEAAWSQADYGDAHVPPGWTFEGYETSNEMERQVGCRCLSCGVVQATEDDLSEQGDCPRCFISRSAVQRFRICRRVGAKLVDVALPAMRIDALTVHAANAETAVENARALGLAGALVAIPEAA
jgi:hypothetical protein